MSRPFTEVGVVRVDVGPARAASAAPARPMRRFAGWLSALVADDGMNGRFAAERTRDEALVRRVEGGRRP